jgi:uncharacterized protein involved in exopolysaccharide biosynthesis
VKYTVRTPTAQEVPGVRQREAAEAFAPDKVRYPSESKVARLRLLWGHRTLLVRAVLCGLVLSTTIAFLIPPRYESTARLMPPDSGQAGGLAAVAATLSGGAGGMGGIASEVLGIKSTSDIFVGILSSRTVQDKLIQQFDLKRIYGYRDMGDTRSQLTKNTGMSVDRKSQIITLTVVDRDPRRAAAIGESYIVELDRLVADLSTSSARRERMFLEERIKKVSEELESSEKEFSEFASKNTAIDIQEQGKSMVDAAAILQGQYIAAQSELEGLKEIYSDNHVRVRAAKARIAELKQQLEKLGGKGEQASETPSRQADYLYPSIRKLPLLGVAYADLFRRTKVEEAVVESLTKEYELAKVQEVKDIPAVKMLDPANVPEKKAFPPRMPIILLGVTLALVAATSWIFGKTSWERVDPSDPRKQFAQEVISAVKGRIPIFRKTAQGRFH